ncbi:MerR family transcriptional regulator [Fusibacter sp. JL216-2]|uniref:MerR family transcriptional regulator n=1 Tax=Fusibacter sp. JL216-2 TaxID=3071453 RepID=UPI003D3257EF
MEYTVKALADIAQVTVRTLHHYDKIGLLKPNHVNASNYRIYTDLEVEKLQQILFFRELDFSLEEIKRILDSPAYDKVSALQSHRDLLEKKKARLDILINTIDKSIEESRGGIKMNAKQKFEGLSKETLQAYKEEAKKKWGKEIVETSEANMRKNNLTEEDLQKRLEEIFTTFAELMQRQEKISDKIKLDEGVLEGELKEEIGKAVVSLQDYMNQFYTCSDEMLLGLSDMYVNDERFYKNISRFGKKLPEFINEAVKNHVKAMKDDI